MKKDSIVNAVNGVTKDWAKRKKSEIRTSRLNVRYYSDRVNHTDVAHSILPKAYAHASNDGAYTLPQRNFYYAAREEFLQQTGREISYERFKTIVLQYMNTHSVDWSITADPRGTFRIPNAAHECKIPVGTIDIDNYLSAEVTGFSSDYESELANIKARIRWQGLGPGHRYQAVLYIEKEGFTPMLQEAEIAEKYDLAILSCKGQSVVAARKLVDHVCHEAGVPLFVVHDFDKAGFEIRNNLTEVSYAAREQNRVAYEFDNDIDVTDFGLRLSDVEQYDLAPETSNFKGGIYPDDLGVTKEEAEFLVSGQRVELNAFTCADFIEWLESKLDEHLPGRLIPPNHILEQAYRRAYAVAKLNRQIAAIRDDAIEEAGKLKIPKTIKRMLKKEMTKSGDAWDVALYKMVKQKF